MLEVLPLPEEDEGALRSYIGSVAIDGSGRSFAAATSPKGGMIGLWSFGDGRWISGFALAADLELLRVSLIPGQG